MVTKHKQQASGDRSADDVVLRVEVHVRPRSATTRVAGTHDGALLVRVAQPAHDGRANQIALQAIADALGVPRRSVEILRGATARRKLIGLSLPPSDVATVQRRLAWLRSERIRGV